MSKKIAFLLSFFCLMIAGGSISAQSVVQVSDNVRDSIVSILIADNGQPLAVGSGLLVRSDGLILTAYDYSYPRSRSFHLQIYFFVSPPADEYRRRDGQCYRVGWEPRRRQNG